MEDSEYHGATPVAGTATAVLDPPRPRLQLTVHDLDSTIQLGLGGSYGKLAEYVAINSVDAPGAQPSAAFTGASLDLPTSLAYGE